MEYRHGLGKCVPDRLRLHLSGHHRKQVRPAEQYGHGQRQRLHWHPIERSKASVIYLLLAADRIERYHLNGHGIVEVSLSGLVESDMGVLSYAQAYNIRRISREQPAITGAFFVNILRIAIDIVDGSKIYMADKPSF